MIALKNQKWIVDITGMKNYKNKVFWSWGCLLKRGKKEFEGVELAVECYGFKTFQGALRNWKAFAKINDIKSCKIRYQK